LITVHVGSSDTIVLVLTIRNGFSLAQAFTPGLVMWPEFLSFQCPRRKRLG